MGHLSIDDIAVSHWRCARPGLSRCYSVIRIRQRIHERCHLVIRSSDTYEGFLPGFQIGAVLNETCLEEWLTELAKRGYDIPEMRFDIYTHAGASSEMERFSRAPAQYRAEDSDSAFITDRVLDYWKLRRDQGWFVHAVFFRPHPPMIAPAPYNEMIDVGDVPHPVRCETREAAAASHPFVKTWLAEQDNATYFESQVNVHAVPEEDREAMRAVYFGLIAEVDHQIGRLITHLKETGEYDETLIIFTSDHGEMLGDHWLWGKGGWYDGSNHIPLIVRDPRDSAARGRGRQITAFTESVDLMPTILDWLGVTVPQECDGASLAPWLVGGRPDRWRRQVHWEFDFRNVQTSFYEQKLGLEPDECTLNVIRDERFKYVHFTSLPPVLYDLAKDPNELNNVAGENQYAGVIAEYAQRLLSLRMLHAERSLTNTMLGPDGPAVHQGPRGTPDALYDDAP